MDWKRIHYLSGITLSIFIGLHLANHAISVLGEEAHLKTMAFLRHLYRNRIAETFLLLAVVVQITSGLRLFFSKRKDVNGLFDKLQIWTGLYLAFFLLVHVSAILFGRLVLHLDTNLYFGAAGINTFPFSLFFIPYYSFAIMAVWGHIAAVHRKKMTVRVFGLSPQVQAKLLLYTGLILAVLILYGLTNHFTGMTIPEEYNVLVGK
ncbi:hypothetical protein [Spirosoma endbachense]|uniref:DUF4405 domain-containing protein n=1 Tax=Spirosoma endbachense TaxID=2666025 RepID=A0A6P1VYZ3_9BACT|nr:hypothetical protein [Spirosoma endbachense]QHV98005.1 hypothetical protein GJR95_24660 [Spirosoma endbachense]